MSTQVRAGEAKKVDSRQSCLEEARPQATPAPAQKVSHDPLKKKVKRKRQVDGGEQLKSRPAKKVKGKDVVDASVLKKYGHLIRQDTQKKRVPHAPGNIAIPNNPDGDSEFESEIFCGEDKDSLWVTYRELAKEIIQGSELVEDKKMHLQVLCFDICKEQDCPLVCPIENCPRGKPVYSRLGYLRHIVEHHLPMKPWWMCPYKGSKKSLGSKTEEMCTKRQPRLIAHIRHVGWDHARSYPLAAALTFDRDLKRLEENTSFDPEFVVTGDKADQFYFKSGKIRKTLVARGKLTKFSPENSEDEEVGMLSTVYMSPKQERVKKFDFTGVGNKSPSTKKNPIVPQKCHKCQIPSKGVEPVNKENAPKGEINSPINLSSLFKEEVPPGGCHRDEPCHETREASDTLIDIMRQMDAGASGIQARPPSLANPLPPVKTAPDLFKFSSESTYIDDRTGSMEELRHQFQRLSALAKEQTEICSSVFPALGTLRVMVDEHEGNIRLSGEQTQQVVDLRKSISRHKQNNTETQRELGTVKERNCTLEAKVKSLQKSNALLQNHVLTLQADVKRLTQETMVAESRILTLQSDPSQVSQMDKLALKVTQLIQEHVSLPPPP